MFTSCRIELVNLPAAQVQQVREQIRFALFRQAASGWPRPRLRNLVIVHVEPSCWKVSRV